MTLKKQYLWEGLTDETRESSEKVVDGGDTGSSSNTGVPTPDLIQERLLDGGTP